MKLKTIVSRFIYLIISNLEAMNIIVLLSLIAPYFVASQGLLGDVLEAQFAVQHPLDDLAFRRLHRRGQLNDVLETQFAVQHPYEAFLYSGFHPNSFRFLRPRFLRQPQFFVNSPEEVPSVLLPPGALLPPPSTIVPPV